MTALTYDDIKGLAARLRRPAQTLYALSDACDPFFITPGRRAAAEWFAAIWEDLAPIGPVHLRRLHYALVSSAAPISKRPGLPGVYTNTYRDWSDLVSAATTARELGLVPAGQFVDRRAGEPSYIFSPQDENSLADVFAHSAVEPPLREDSVIAVSSQAYEFPNLPGLHVMPPRVAEPYAVEIWIEKSTMNDVLVPLARARGVTLVTGMGELSLTHCHQFIERVLKHGRAARILYVSDFDPAGNGMPVSVARKIEYILARDGLDLDIRLDPLALTAEQVRRYRLPRIPIKESDSRKASFEAQHGEGAVELDALEALRPGELARIVNAAIDTYREAAQETRREIAAACNELRQRANDARESVLDEHRDDIEELKSDFKQMHAQIAPHEAARLALVEEFKARIAEHDDAISTAVDGFYGKAEAVFAEIVADLDDAAPDPDDVEWPDGYVADESDAQLYQSDRDYLEQIDAYKKHQGKPTQRRRNGGAP